MIGAEAGADDFLLAARSDSDEEFFYGRGFDPQLDRSWTPRELAIAWANAERKHLEEGRRVIDAYQLLFGAVCGL